MKYLFLLTGLALAIISTGCGEEKINLKNSPESITVTTTEVSAGNSTGLRYASGKVEALQSANISTRMMGYIKKISVAVGQKINKGAILAEIQSDDLNAKLSQVNAGINEASAALKNAERDYERFTALFQQQSASQKELDDMTTRFEMAKARVESAKQMKNEIMAQFSYTTLRAPFSGTITNTFVKEGDMANPGMPLLTIETPGQTEITAFIAESDIHAVHEGMPVDIHVKNNSKHLKGKVREVSLSAKNTGGQYLIKITPESTPKDVLPGMFVQVTFNEEASGIKTNGTILIPKKALIHDGQLTGIYTIGDGNTAVLRWLRTGTETNDMIEVLSGLSAGEKYITSSDSRIYNGIKVNIQN